VKLAKRKIRMKLETLKPSMTALRPIYYTPVAGTWGWSESEDGVYDWWEYGSEFNKFCYERNTILVRPNNPFIWSTNLDGTFLGRWEWVGKLLNHSKGNRNWDAAGWAFSQYQSTISYWSRPVISHSHGFQVVAYACGKYNLKIPLLVTFGAPIRSDLKELYCKARNNIKHWIHIYDPNDDIIQWLGMLFDNDIANIPDCELADVRLRIPNSQHSNLLKNPDYFSLLDEYKVFELMRYGLT
jgi:hypothetical protein